MDKSEMNPPTLLLAVLASGFLLSDFASKDAHHPLAAVGGLIILFVLFAYDREGDRSGLQSLAFGAVCGFALMPIILALQEMNVVARGGGGFGGLFAPLAWVVATLIFTLIDRARISSRVAVPRAPAVMSIPAAPREVVQPAAEPQQAPSMPSAEQVTPAAPAAEPQPPAPATAPRAVPLPKGKETEIYVNLVGEGLAIMRTVRAQHMGKDFYLITEPMPEGEQWEFTTGQIVRCKKRNLSHGKGLVAVEEAPRAS